ncbi:MAG: YHS domain-containing (seleno)protein [Planctomycetota bacterium]
MLHYVLMLAACMGLVMSAQADPPSNTDKRGLAIKGYDPVAYFPEYGGEPTKGKKDLAVEHAGATYRFASEANRKVFLSDPEAYAPAYGGWCAYAMAEGETVRVDPKRYEFHEGRVYLFYRDWFTDTLKPWQEDRDALQVRADQAWSEIVQASEE